jgi:predicted regulator of Ras-like GTPase activity (Roadblock/LC7/MglB family)
MIDKIIKNVLELPGVDGACILDKKGVLLHNALPDFFLDDFLDDLARRIRTLYEAVDENYTACDDYLIKFPEKYIRLRRSRNVYLLVVVDPTVNLTTLRMVTNLVLKHITPKVLGEMRKLLEAQATAQPDSPDLRSDPPEQAPAASAPSPEPKPPVRGTKVPRPRPSRSFRGNRY